MISQSTTWYHLILVYHTLSQGITWYQIVSRGIAQYLLLQHGIIRYYIGTIWYHLISHDIICDIKRSHIVSLYQETGLMNCYVYYS